MRGCACVRVQRKSRRLAPEMIRQFLNLVHARIRDATLGQFSEPRVLKLCFFGDSWPLAFSAVEFVKHVRKNRLVHMLLIVALKCHYVKHHIASAFY